MSGYDSSVIGATWFPGGMVGDVEGADVEGIYDAYGNEVGRRHRRRGHHAAAPAPGMVRVPNLTDHQLASAAQAKGLMVVPQNTNQAGAQGMTMPGGHLLQASGQRRQPAAFQTAAAIAPGAPWSVVAQIQRGYQATRILVQAVVDATGADANGFNDIQALNVGQRNQVVSPGSLVTSLFLPNTFDAQLLLDPAGSGNFIVISGVISAAAPSAVTVRASAVGASSL